MARRVSVQAEVTGVLSAVLLGLVLTHYAGLIWSISRRANGVDFVQFYASARAVVEGRGLYEPMSMRDIGMKPPPGRDAAERLHPNLNPPLLAVLLAPVSARGISASYVVWSVLSLLCGLAALWGITRALIGQAGESARVVWLWLALLGYYPTHTAVMLGQVTLVLMAVLVGAWWAARSGHDRVAGLLIGLALNLKLFVGLVVLYFAWQRRWRAAAWAAGSTVLIALATVPIVGLTAYLDYLRLMPAVDWYSSNWNASFASVLTRVLGGSENEPFVDVPEVAKSLVLLSSTVAVGLLAWLTRPNGATNRVERFDSGFGLTLIVMLLVSPLGWMYYFPLLVLPGYLVWLGPARRIVVSTRLGLLAAWGLSTVPLAMVRAAEVNSPARWLTLDSLYLYALCLMLVVAVRAFPPASRTVHVAPGSRS